MKLLSVVWLLSGLVGAQNLAPLANWWTPNGEITDAVPIGDTLYMIGDFRQVGPYTGNMAIVDSNMNVLATPPLANGAVKAAVSDGEGGWFIGGDFTSIGSTPRLRLAHIDANGQVTERLQNIGVSDEVRSLVKQGDTLYVGGIFYSAGPYSTQGDGATGLLRVDAQGKVLPSNLPHVAGDVKVMISDNEGGYFIGGSFQKVNGVTRRSLAHILADGTLGSMNLLVAGDVEELAYDGTYLYVGGTFESIDRVARKNLARVLVSTGMLDTWNHTLLNPSTSYVKGQIWDMKIVGERLWISGDFAIPYGPDTLRHLAAFDLNTGKPIVKNYGLSVSNSNFCTQMVAYGDTLFVAGSFQNFGGVAKTNSIAAVNSQTGDVIPFQITNITSIRSLQLHDNKLYGNMGSTILVYDLIQKKSTKLTLPTIKTWGFNYMEHLTLQGDTLFIFGSFDTVGTVSQKGAAAFSTVTGELLNWKLQTTEIYPNWIHPDGDAFLVAGTFDMYNHQTRYGLFSIDLQADTLTKWNPMTKKATPWIQAMVADSTRLFVAGVFDYIGGGFRNNLAAITLDSGKATPFKADISANDFVYAMALMHDTLIVAGSYESIGNTYCGNACAVNTQTNQVLQGVQLPGSPVFSLHVTDKEIYVGGLFTAIAGVGSARLGRVDRATGKALAWPVKINSGVDAIYPLGNRVVAGGSFTNDTLAGHNFTTILDSTTGVPLQPSTRANGNVKGIVASESQFLVYGEFDSYGGVQRKGLVGIDLHTGKATGMNVTLGANDFYKDIDTLDGALLLGGRLSKVQGQKKQNIVKVDPKNGDLLPFPASANGDVNQLRHIDGKIVVAGSGIQQVNNTPRNMLGMLDLQGNLDPIDFGVTGGMYSYFVKDIGNHQIVGNNQKAYRIADGTASDYSLVTDSAIADIKYYDGMRYIVGSFNTVNGVSSPRIAAFDSLEQLKPIGFTALPTALIFMQDKRFVTMTKQRNSMLVGSDEVYAIDVRTGQIEYLQIKHLTYGSVNWVWAMDSLVLVNTASTNYTPAGMLAYIRPSVSIQFTTDSGAVLVGAATQSIFAGANIDSVKVVPTETCRFMGWSDGSKENPRITLHTQNSRTIHAKVQCGFPVSTNPQIKSKSAVNFQAHRTALGLQILVEGVLEKRAVLQIMDLQGRLLRQIPVETINGATEIYIPTHDLGAQKRVIRLLSGNTIQATQMF